MPGEDFQKNSESKIQVFFLYLNGNFINFVFFEKINQKIWK